MSTTQTAALMSSEAIAEELGAIADAATAGSQARPYTQEEQQRRHELSAELDHRRDLERIEEETSRPTASERIRDARALRQPDTLELARRYAQLLEDPDRAEEAAAVGEELAARYGSHSKSERVTADAIEATQFQPDDLAPYPTPEELAVALARVDQIMPAVLACAIVSGFPDYRTDLETVLRSYGRR